MPTRSHHLWLNTGASQKSPPLKHAACPGAAGAFGATSAAQDLSSQPFPRATCVNPDVSLLLCIASTLVLGQRSAAHQGWGPYALYRNHPGTTSRGESNPCAGGKSTLAAPCTPTNGVLGCKARVLLSVESFGIWRFILNSTCHNSSREERQQASSSWLPLGWALGASSPLRKDKPPRGPGFGC